MERQVLACETLANDRQFNAACRPVVSMALAAAQQKLERLRLVYRPNKTKRQINTFVKVGRSKPPQLQEVHQTRPNSLPDHLGWHSAPLTNALRRTLKNQERPSKTAHPLPPPQHTTTKNHTDYRLPTTDYPTHIKLPPDIALAILRKKLAAPGRIWLLLRHLDIDGKGWVTAENARLQLTEKTSPMAVCGKRQLRNLLTAGDNIFWHRDDERIWLHSMARVAATLGLEQLNGRSVKLPLAIFLESIGTVRAHLYATFHSGRQKTAAVGSNSKPISRETLETLSSATRRTQRLYEKRVGIKPKANYAIGQPHSIETAQNTAWKQGTAVFNFHDKKGLIGASGQQYLAWQLPNSYDGPHDILSRGHQRQINRQLADLLNEGITGNGENEGDNDAGESQNGMKRPIFYRNGATAAKTYNRSPEQDYYWHGRINRRQFSLWHHLPAVDKGKNGR